MNGPATAQARPLFADRRTGQCCWPLWGDDTSIEHKRCCGAPYSPASRIPYCPDHMGRNGGTGTTGERTAANVLIALTTPKGAKR